nr:DUF1775 domain-containing protein [Kibdelosporangium sp. MJ126-NF4]
MLSTGIQPGDIALVSGPAGWTLTTAADGYTVAGPALPVGQNAEYSVKVATMHSDTTSLAFKTLQNYSDGRTDRWIELPDVGVLVAPALLGGEIASCRCG